MTKKVYVYIIKSSKSPLPIFSGIDCIKSSSSKALTYLKKIGAELINDKWTKKVQIDEAYFITQDITYYDIERFEVT